MQAGEVLNRQPHAQSGFPLNAQGRNQGFNLSTPLGLLSSPATQLSMSEKRIWRYSNRSTFN